MSGRLRGKVAIITGGPSGIGKRTVEAFAQEGASVLLAARREKEGRVLADALGSKVIFLKTDVSKEADVKAMIDYAVYRFGRLDCLFNNAGCPAPIGSIETIPLDKYEAALSVLLGGVMLGMKHAAPVMRTQGSGSIINNGSVAGVLAGYSSSISRDRSPFTLYFCSMNICWPSALPVMMSVQTSKGVRWSGPVSRPVPSEVQSDRFQSGKTGPFRFP